MRRFKFNKEDDDKWYVVLPEWEGEKSDLEMVCGADTMLDILAQGGDTVDLNISETPFDNPRFELHFEKEEGEGGWYKLRSETGMLFDVWLCYVVKFVFNGLPKTLYCA